MVKGLERPLDRNRKTTSRSLFPLPNEHLPRWYFILSFLLTLAEVKCDLNVMVDRNVISRKFVEGT